MPCMDARSQHFRYSHYYNALIPSCIYPQNVMDHVCAHVAHIWDRSLCNHFNSRPTCCAMERMYAVRQQSKCFESLDLHLGILMNLSINCKLSSQVSTTQIGITVPKLGVNRDMKCQIHVFFGSTISCSVRYMCLNLL